MTLLLRPDAAAEMDEAADWYDRQLDGLGDEFLDEVKATFKAIEGDPLRYALYEGRRLKKPARRALVKRFPYVVSFEVEGDTIVILSVFHGHRRPGYWKKR